MPTRINGNDVTIPGTLFLTGPGVEGFVLTLGPGGAVIASSVGIANLELLNGATPDNTPNTLVLRNASGGFSCGTLQVNGNVVLPATDARFAFLDHNGVLSSDSARFERFSTFSTILHGGTSAGAGPSRLGIISTEAIIVSAQAEFNVGCATVGLAPTNSIRNDGSFWVCNSDLNLAFTADSMRMRGAGLDGTGGKLQLKNLDDGLFYDVVLRTVAGVPTLSVEGAGEA